MNLSNAIKVAINETDGNKAAAARALGISRTTLYRYIENDDDLRSAVKSRSEYEMPEIKRRIMSLQKNGNRKNARKFARNSGYVYLVQETWRGMVKIGVTKDLQSRMSAIKSNCPQEVVIVDYVLVKNPIEFESTLHQKYREHIYSGEWFDLTGEQVEEILECFTHKRTRQNG